MTLPDDPLIVGADFGTSALKLVVMDPSGGRRADCRVDYPTQREGTRVEQDPHDWWEALREALDQAVVGAGLADRVVGIGLTGQMQDVVLLSTDGLPTGPSILYSDLRAGQEFEELAGALPDWTERTGSIQDASGILPKLLWLSRHQPERLDGAAHLVFGPAAAIAARLGAPALTDPTTASTTGVLELASRSWWAEGLATARKRRDMPDVSRLLPRVVPAGTVGARLAEPTAEDLGVPVGTAVVLGLGDAGATTEGLSGAAPGQAYASLGTSGWIAGVLPDRAPSGAPARRSAMHRLALDEATDLGIAAPQSAGGAADWARRELLGGIGPEAADRAAADRLPLLDRRPLCLPSLTGERYPVRDAAARGSFVGITPETTAVDLYLAVLSGVAYSLAVAVDELGLTQEVLPAVGAGSSSPVWRQLLADATGTGVLPIPQAEAAAAHHAACAAADATVPGHRILPLGRRGSARARRGAGITWPSAETGEHQRRRDLHRNLQETLQGTFDALRPPTP